MGDAQPRFLPEKYIWLKGQREIDFLNMDEELSRIPVLVQEASEAAALANEIRETAKDNLSTVSATVSSALRKEIGPNNKARSETQIDSELPLSPSYQSALAEYSESRLDSGLWGSMVEALRTKSSALRVSADLISSGFLTTNYVLDKRRAEIRAAKPA